MRILLVYSYPATFITIDAEILRSSHIVSELCWRRRPFTAFFQDLLAAVCGAMASDVIVAWFGGVHALAPFLVGRLLGRRCVVIASGYDVANEPSLDYGNMRPGLRRWMGRIVFRLAHRILAVSHFTAKEVSRNTGVKPEKIRVIPHGVASCSGADRAPGQKVKVGVLTVGTIDRNNLKRKGLAHYVEAARLLPDVPFRIVGPAGDDAINELRRLAPPNVSFMGPRYGAELWNIFGEAKVYAQLSAYESFGMAVAEAMLNECVPVVTDRGALPEVVGDAGFVTRYGDTQAIAAAIEQALATPPATGVSCRHWVEREFALENRRRILLASLKDVTHSDQEKLYR